MRFHFVPLVLPVLSIVFAAEQPWPAKGDTVYVSAAFKKVSAPSPVAGTKMEYDVPPCAALVVTKADPKKDRWVTKDPVGGSEQLEGSWLPRMHKTKPECEERYATAGEPNIAQSGGAYKIVPVDSK